MEAIQVSRIVELKPIAQNQWSLWVKLDSQKAGQFSSFWPGQFCMLSLFDLVDPLSPRPFVIVEMKQNDQKESLIRFIFRVTGKFTSLLTTLNLGTRIGLLGPLGKKFDLQPFLKKKIAFIAGGVGYASVIPFLLELKNQNAEDPLVYYGVRSDLEVIRQGPYTARYASDDGTIGFKGRLHDFLKAESKVIESADLFLISGPTPMMKSIYDVLPPAKSHYFLEEAMGCGFGICMSCLVPIKKGNEQINRVRSCIDGPIFKGDLLEVWRKGA